MYTCTYMLRESIRACEQYMVPILLEISINVLVFYIDVYKFQQVKNIFFPYLMRRIFCISNVYLRIHI